MTMAASLSTGSGWRKTIRRGKPVLIIDFYFLDQNGRKQRVRRDATVQTNAATAAEARRLMSQAAELGYIVDKSEHEKAKEPKPLTFSDFVSDVFTSRFLPTYKAETAKRYRALLSQDILARLGSIPLTGINADVFRDFANFLQSRPRKKGAGQGVQLKGPLTLVRTILRAAVESGALPAMPSLPALVKHSKKLPRGPVRSEVEDLLGHCPPWLKIACALAAYGGLRSGELRALEVRDIDLTRGIIMIRRALSGDVVGVTKGDEERDVPIPLPLGVLLREAIKGNAKTTRLVRLSTSGLVPSRQRLLKEIRAVQKKRGLPPWGVHALRHFFCSALAAAGVGIETIRVLAGHQDIETTARYLHVRQSELELAVGVFDAAQVGQHLGNRVLPESASG